MEVGRPLRALAARHSLAAVEVRDPREATLPAGGRLRLVDPETGVQVEADTRDRRLRERYAAREREARGLSGRDPPGRSRPRGAHHGRPLAAQLGGRLR